MADWKNLTVRDVITEIESGNIVLPVIQRRLEWPADKMEMLYDSLFRQNSFGSIICIEEASGLEPLFAHRFFTKDGSLTDSFMPEKVANALMLVIDGQQRLQSFYMGLCGNYNGKVLYYDLFSNFKAYDYNFNFAMTREELPSENSENSELGKYFWYPAPYLFARLKALANTDLVADEIISEYEITDLLMQKYVEKNVEGFFMRIFADHSIGISKVAARLSRDVLEDRQRVTELFRRLNFEGMKLSNLDLVASLLKNFDYRMENFIDEVCRNNSDIGINQDVLVKLLLILNDKPGKNMMDLNAEDAMFATTKRGRIEATLEALKNFLIASGNENWYKGGHGAIKKSAIPLYFLAYHIFHSQHSDKELPSIFCRFDVRDEDFRAMSLWLKLSLLNKVFSGRNAGWRPETTGIRKIHEVMSRNKGKIFPVQELFDLYHERLHNFFDDKSISLSNIDELDQEYMLYLMYNGTGRSSIRLEDKDHIHPKSLLEKRGFSQAKINSIGNFQLIDFASNRGLKNDKPLIEWLEEVDDRGAYLTGHLIPEDPRLWDVSNFSEFLKERQKKIIAKIKASLPTL